MQPDDEVILGGGVGGALVAFKNRLVRCSCSVMHVAHLHSRCINACIIYVMEDEQA